MRAVAAQVREAVCHRRGDGARSDGPWEERAGFKVAVDHDVRAGTEERDHVAGHVRDAAVDVGRVIGHEIIRQRHERNVVEIGIARRREIGVKIRAGKEPGVAREPPLRQARGRYAVGGLRHVEVVRLRDGLWRELLVDVSLRPHRAHAHQFVRRRAVGKAVQQIYRQQIVGVHGHGLDGEKSQRRRARHAVVKIAQRAGDNRRHRRA